MAAFGRRRAGSGDGDPVRPGGDVTGGRRRPTLSRETRRKQLERDKLDATPPWETERRDSGAATTGPWDLADLPADDTVARVDLGGLRLPVRDDVDIRVEAAPDGQVQSATVVHRGSQMQLGVFAAPRAEGIWDEIRAELAGSITGGGGRAADHADGPFGTELRGTLASGRGAGTPVRFLGVDGPRWFLRAMLVGPAAADAALAEPFESYLRDTVVVRGREPLPVREAVPLQLPRAEEGEDTPAAALDPTADPAAADAGGAGDAPGRDDPSDPDAG